MGLSFNDRVITTVAIVAAGGRGRRLDATRPKQLHEIGGRPLLERSLAALLTHPAIDGVVVALPPDIAADPPSYLRVAAKPLRLVPGGPRRQDSVANAFAAVDEAADVVLIHDAARPFASENLITRCILAAAESGAAVAAVASRDTVKVSSADQFVRETLPRERIYLAQTPQAFQRRVLRDALALAEQGQDVTDEATLAERAGFAVRIVEGEHSNIKITVPEDVPVAEALAAHQPRVTKLDDAVGGRVGIGYDVHRLVEGRPLLLAGVPIPFDKGLLGHSDADVVCHAVTDALLGAAALGDIGRHFPDTDPQYAGASSVDLLMRATSLVLRAGFAIMNVDVVVIAQRPKLAPHVDAMREQLASALGIEPARVSIKGKTNEGLDAIGRGEAIAAHAVALVQRMREPSSRGT